MDQTAEAITLPMYDGELGVRPGRAALVGQLGPGELRFTAGGVTTRYFVDGGFAQVRANTVTVLTGSAKKAADIKAEDLTKENEKAAALPSTNGVERASRQRAQQRATAMTKVAAKVAGA
ncbi:ATP synthase epsilon chain [Fimbriiglobus ruber]|uniref:ATP synthase epsilon chain n=1 Tax=Fimbriiglobus ruber TaxID=1908690 RepID=A0A225ECT7_9BACT|nr:ATP synthase epsilon chain [Fimbriiglobus ruber]